MQFRRVLAALAAVATMVVGAGTASAQNPMWTGFYVGGHVGYGWERGDGDGDLAGAVGGIQGGYNFQMNQVLLGIEADYSFSGMSDKFTDSDGISVSGDVNGLWSVRGRLGFMPMRELLVYATAGYGGFSIDVKATDGVDTIKAEGSFRGLVAGAGVEYLFTPNWIGRGEILFYNGNGRGLASGIDGDLAVVRAGLSYKF